jgi:hypothetical protein
MREPRNAQAKFASLTTSHHATWPPRWTFASLQKFFVRMPFKVVETHTSVLDLGYLLSELVDVGTPW